MAIDLDDFLAGYHLLNEAVHAAQVALPLHEVFAGKLSETGRHLIHEESHQNGHDGERDTQDDHAHECGDNRDE